MPIVFDGDASADFQTPLPVAEGGTGATASTGSGNVVLSASPTLTGTVTLSTPLAVESGGTGGTGGGMPAGTLIDFAGTSAPTGFLVCPTSASDISRTTYADLFSAIGTTWGVGDGSTTFGLPWFAADYVAGQADGNVGTTDVGEVIGHTHTISTRTGAGCGGGTAGSGLCVVGSTTSSTGGAANIAAQVRVLKCIKF